VYCSLPSRKSMRHRWTWWCQLLILFGLVVNIERCFGIISMGTCGFHTKGGNKYDLSPMTRGPKQDYNASDTSGGKIFVNICAKTTTVDCGPSDNVCQITSQTTFSCGKFDAFNMTEMSPPDSGVIIHCGNGSSCGRYGSRSSTIKIFCTPGVIPGRIKKNVDVDLCFYTVLMESEYACPQRNNHQIDGGWIFVIALVGLATLYLIFGAIWEWKKDGAISIPNKRFWSSVRILIVDGFRFTHAKITRNSGYQAL